MIRDGITTGNVVKNTHRNTAIPASQSLLRRIDRVEDALRRID
jgi:hypothetical protein